MQLVFDDTLFVHYGFMFLSPADDEDPDLDESRRGQVNGLLGAATGRAVSMMVGTHTGEVPLRVQWHESEAGLEDGRDDIVEASIDISGADMRVAAFDDTREVRVPALGPHRARLCAAGFEAASRDEILDEDAPVPDRYLLQLWPAATAADAVVRVSGPAAQYWHDETRKITALSAEEWSARQATSNPSASGGYQPWAPNVGRGLSDERLLGEIPLSLRVELREPLARRACETAGIADREPISQALDALRRWQPLPAAMTSADQVLAGLRNDDVGPGGAFAGSAMSGTDPVEPAVRAVFAAADPDTVMNMTVLLDLAKMATGRNGEDLIQDVCAERGYG